MPERFNDSPLIEMPASFCLATPPSLYLSQFRLSACPLSTFTQWDANILWHGKQRLSVSEPPNRGKYRTLIRPICIGTGGQRVWLRQMRRLKKHGTSMVIVGPVIFYMDLFVFVYVCFL